ncbi:MAG TPA: hypothetical protein VFL15_00520, partial [Gammaproteobacteria bacterium]|nr:hypothetical protein [Gammaproteobacteria bacterium]
RVSIEDIAEACGIEISEKSRGWLGEMLLKVQAKKLSVVTLDSSYGFSFSCLCSGVELVDDWKKLIAQ